MQPKAKPLREILRFGITETKDRRSRTRSRVYSLQTSIYGKLLLSLVFAALILYGSGAIKVLFTFFQKLF
jgi:hypothetical protein